MVRHETSSVGRYRLTDELGSGGFATVYRAYDPVLDRAIALKVLHPHLARDIATRERFVSEGRALARIHHPNIVQVFDAGEADGLVYLAMELVDGCSLATLLRERGRFSLVETAEVAGEVAAALAAVHARGLVHCDVKPANILVEEESGRAVLLDLGVSRRVDDSASTSGGWLVGTPAFMAPEQITPGGRVTAQTDVYQLGATVYVLLAGEPPFTGEPTQVMYAVVHQQSPDLATLRPGLSPAVGALVDAALAKEPAERPPGPLAFAVPLRELAGLAPRPARGAPAPPERPTEAVTRATPRTVPAPVLTAAEATMPVPPPRTERVVLAPRGPAPASAPARPSHPRRSPLPLLLVGLVGLLALAAIGGALWLRGSSSAPRDEQPAAQPPSVAVLPFTATPQASPAPRTSPTPAPARSPAPTAAPAPPAPPPGGDVAAVLAGAIASRGYSPSGPVVQVPAGGGTTLAVQHGDGPDGQRLFIAVNGAYLGTDWQDASPMGVSDPVPAGPGRFAAAYGDYDGRPPVTVTFTWTGAALRPDQIAPGHCLPNTGC